MNNKLIIVNMLEFDLNDNSNDINSMRKIMIMKKS